MLTNQTKRSPLQNRFPQVVVLAFLSTLLMVSCHEVTEVLDRGAERLFQEHNSIDGYRRHYKFYNHCSERQIQIVGQAVTAQGNKDSPFTSVRIETVHYHDHYGVNIIGEQSGRYLCFNKKSKLITRFSGRSPRCMFEEHFSSDAMYTTLRSVFNPDWFVGFNRKGKPLPGIEHLKTRRDRCFYFTKWNHTYLDFQEHMNPGPHMHNAHKLTGYLREQRLKRKKRHLRWRTR